MDSEAHNESWHLQHQLMLILLLLAWWCITLSVKCKWELVVWNVPCPGHSVPSLYRSLSKIVPVGRMREHHTLPTHLSSKNHSHPHMQNNNNKKNKRKTTEIKQQGCSWLTTSYLYIMCNMKGNNQLSLSTVSKHRQDW